MDINDRKWYDAMFKRVADIIETIVLLDANFIGYIRAEIEGQETTISWNARIVTVTTDVYKWEMPLGWFVDAEMKDKIAKALKIELSISDPVEQPQREQAAEPEPVISDEGPGTSLLASPPRADPGVRSIAEIMAEGLDED